ncbi:vWA domain-containing protein [Sulfuriroseicoccus oceanibius]|uniref:VWA domain-containing protein n=1 Tax=Sulfuriroseicoccus oceanibius TaxID=2707525 RepID=A0A6B3LA28_9BACT|nr:vWA domain-containing protein [Sulfuriroseicoccus oceanibius]QQL43753.1 VWA domain-containing protein [Sulfuriroseicoccus oceanibius]
MNTNLTEIAYILDRSGSMSPFQEAAVTGFNQFLKEQQETDGDANLTLVLFDDEYLLHADSEPVAEVNPLTARTYIPRGMTALLDAIGRTIDNIGKKLAKMPEAERPGKVIIAIYTDGYENASTDYSARKIREMIQHQTNEYQWEFLFLAATQNAMETAADYGVQSQNASCVADGEAGVMSSYSSVSRRVTATRLFQKGVRSKKVCKDLRTTLSDIVEEEEGRR